MEQQTSPSEKQEAEAKRLVSKLTKGRERFLAHVIEHGLEVGRRTPEDFVRHFPPMAIMEGLRNQPRLRAGILCLTTGTKQRVALKKSWESCGEDLQIALDEGETDAQAIVALFDFDDRVRFLDEKKLWSFITEGVFWKTPPSRQKDFEAAKSHVAYMLDRGLEDQLITHEDIVEGITVDELVARLPKSELGNIIKGALANGKKSAAFTERDLVASMPPKVLVNFVPLSHLWEAIIQPRIAEKHGYVEAPEQKDDGKAAPEESSSRAAVPEAPAVAPGELFGNNGSSGEAKTKGPVKATPAAGEQAKPAAGGDTVDPTDWSSELTEDAEFVSDDDLLEEPTIRGAMG